MIYLDNAATSFPKPRPVCDEIYRCMRFYCGNPGRGAHSLSMAAAEKIYECREAAASLLGCGEPENIVFTLNTTQALNMAIKGILKKGDHILISDMEHNSVFRPIYRLAADGIIEYDIFPTMTADPRRSPVRICAGIAKRLKPNTKMVLCAHASNICSAVLPVREIGAFCRRHKLLFAIDAAQSAGHIPVNMQDMNIDLLCAPGHKGLLGPQGSGIMAIGSDIILDTLTEGGNGINSLEGNMPEMSPERYEAGTLAVPAIAGLAEGIGVVKKLGLERIMSHERSLYEGLLERLNGIAGVTVYAPGYPGPVLLFNIRNISSDNVGRELDRQGICVRSGFHCSPLGHATLGTPSYGAVRVSFGIYNTMSEIDTIYREIKRIAK